MKKIALVADVKKWSFDIDAHLMKKALESDFIVDIFFSKEEPINRDFIKLVEYVKDYDIIFFFWRKDLLPLTDEKIRQELINREINIETFIKKVVTEVFDHMFIEDDSINTILNNYCRCYTVSTNILYDIYCENPKLKKPYCVLTDTFDEGIFYPENLERFDEKGNKPLVIGWIGNSKWNEKIKDDFKGYQTIYQPICQQLIDEGYNIKCVNADKNVKLIPNNEMRDYYKQIDLYVCVSTNEGTPRPLIESMGCGIPIITTDVGLARQCLGKLQQNYIIGSRENGKNDDEIRMRLREKIIELYENRSILQKLSRENYQESKKINLSSMTEKYRNFFIELTNSEPLG